jgi:hypothetical protein
MNRAAIVLLVFTTLSCPAARSAEEPREIAPAAALVLPRVGQSGRGPIHLDALEALLVAGKWAAPKAGDTVTAPDGSTRAWEEAKVGADGWLNHRALAGGYAYFPIASDSERVMILEASGHTLSYFNGEPHAGDPYQYGYLRVPVMLRKGTNDLLLLGGRGRVRAKLIAPKAAAQLDLGDVTQPDLIAGQPTDTHAALPILNATSATLDGLTIEATFGDNRIALTGKTGAASMRWKC